MVARINVTAAYRPTSQVTVTFSSTKPPDDPAAAWGAEVAEAMRGFEDVLMPQTWLIADSAGVTVEDDQ